jgi:hypothetical protein
VGQVELRVATEGRQGVHVALAHQHQVQLRDRIVLEVGRDKVRKAAFNLVAIRQS